MQHCNPGFAVDLQAQPGIRRLQRLTSWLAIMHKGNYAPVFRPPGENNRHENAPEARFSASAHRLIPPSISFIVYAGIASVSVGSLFLAGIVPGLLMAPRA
jgi:hypothetical protein